MEIKRWLIAALCVVPVPMCFGQIVARLYYDEDWFLTRRDSAVYFRVAVMDTAAQTLVGDVKDFTKNGKLMMTGTYQNGQRNGAFVSYYRNGKKESEGTCENDKRTGRWKYYHANGLLKSEVRFDGNVPGVVEARDSAGAILVSQGTGAWEERYLEFGSGQTVVRGKLKDYLPDGTWTHADPQGMIWAEEVFKDGAFVSGYIIADSMRIELVMPFLEIVHEDSKHEKIRQFAFSEGVTSRDYPYIKHLKEHPDWAGALFLSVGISGRPQGGMNAFYQAVSSLLKYPKTARTRGIEGRVFVEFVIERDGSLSNVKAVKGVGGGLDEEAVRVVVASQNKVKWLPGVQGRKRVKQRYTLPIIFKLG